MSMPARQLAQLNIAQLSAPLYSPQLADFVRNLERINRLAETSEGFVWRYSSSPGNSAMEARLFGEDHIITMSTWTDQESLQAFVYRSAHAPIMARRKEWFIPLGAPHQVLWWIPEGTRPTLLEGSRRLDSLREHGPGPSAFTFKHAVSAGNAAA